MKQIVIEAWDRKAVSRSYIYFIYSLKFSSWTCDSGKWELKADTLLLPSKQKKCHFGRG